MANIVDNAARKAVMDRRKFLQISGRGAALATGIAALGGLEVLTTQCRNSSETPKPNPTGSTYLVRDDVGVIATLPNKTGDVITVSPASLGMGSDVEQNYISAWTPGFGRRLGSNTTNGQITFTVPSEGAYIFTFNTANKARRDLVKNGNLAYGRNSKMGMKNAPSYSGTDYTAEIDAFVQDWNDILSISSGMSLGSLAKVDSNPTFTLGFYKDPSDPAFGYRTINNKIPAILINEAHMDSPLILRQIIRDESHEGLLGIDDIMGSDSIAAFLDPRSGLYTPEGKDLVRTPYLL